MNTNTTVTPPQNDGYAAAHSSVMDNITMECSHLACLGDVESSWFLQGCVDALSGNEADAPDEYRREYMLGYRAASKL